MSYHLGEILKLKYEPQAESSRVKLEKEEAKLIAKSMGIRPIRETENIQTAFQNSNRSVTYSGYELVFTEDAKKELEKADNYTDVFNKLKEGRDYFREEKSYKKKIVSSWREQPRPFGRPRGRPRSSKIIASIIAMLMPVLSSEYFTRFTYWEGGGKEGVKAYYDTNKDGFEDKAAAFLACYYDIKDKPFAVYDIDNNLLYIDNKNNKSDGSVDKIVRNFDGNRKIYLDAPDCIGI